MVLAEVNAGKVYMESLDYEQLISHLSSTACFQNALPTNLLCLSATEQYFESELKVMVFGQETNNWLDKFLDTGGVTALIKTYNGFYNSGKCYSYGGYFWNALSKLKSRLELENQENQVGILWNNILKIGRYREKGTPSKDIIVWQKPAIDFIKEEIAHFSPNIVIFFTGPYYDRHIKNAFNDVSFEPINARPKHQLARVVSQYLPHKSIRTYHPGYLWRNGFYQYLDEIMAEIV